MPINLTHIELFAGCGGMSLGLESSGFDLYFANELSPMAGETFAFNILNENLNLISEKKKSAKKTLWIKSNFPSDDLKNRLRENPFSTSKGKYSDLKSSTDLKEKLLIGNIDDLLSFFEENPTLVNNLKKENIDLISGGPPCQSFSLAGKREKNNEKNQLPLSFSKFAGLLQPKIVLLENVKGITSPFTEEGKKYYAWLEVSKAFALEGFVPVCLMLNSKYFGVPQNRPRFILLGYRKDIFNALQEKLKENKVLAASKKFYDLVIDIDSKIESITIDDFSYVDIETSPELFDGIIFPKITHFQNDFVQTCEAIGDIKDIEDLHLLNDIRGKFAKQLNKLFSQKNKKETRLKNHEVRKHSLQIKSRFRFYQVIEQFQNGLKKGAIDLFTGKEISIETTNQLFEEFSKYKLLFIENGREYSTKPKNISEVENLIKQIPTKKHSQRALREFEPAPAQLTIPDDLCHYDLEQPRTLTVREMARFQSFPDWFVFRSKVTTGGKMRKFETPQYTQVGNAVPPLLAKALGEIIKTHLLIIKN